MTAEPKMLYTFYETHVFTMQLMKFGSDDLLSAIQNELNESPERWPLVKGTNGARKGRIAEPHSDKGKRGSYRYLYLFVEHREQVFLLWLYTKNKQSDLSDEQRETVKKIVNAIKSAKRSKLK